MSTFDRVKNAKSPQDALAALAHSLDVLHGKFDKLNDAPHDPWTSWQEADPGQPNVQSGPTPERRVSQQAAQESVAQLERAISETTDEDERKALQAQLDLAQDELREVTAIEAGPEPSASTVERSPDGSIVVNLPPASEEKREKREGLATIMQLEDDAHDAFVKGGPLWLYYSDREFVKQMPRDVIMALVLDVNEDDPIEAATLSADLLKFEDVEGPDTLLGRIHGS